MVERSVLHQLVDTLPENVLAKVQHILEYQQNPREQHQDIEMLRAQMQQHIRRHLERTRGGAVVGGGGGGGMWPDGTGSYSVQGFDEDGAHLTLARRYFRGKVLEIVERVSLSDDGKLLTYKQEVTGPTGERSTHQAQFSMFVPEDNADR